LKGSFWNNLKTSFFYIKNEIKIRAEEAVIRDRYAICCVLSALASALSVVNPLLTALIVQNIINNFNLKGIVPSIIAMIMVKGTKMLLRGKVSKLLRGGDVRAPSAWLQRRISKKLWWLEPMINNWGFLGVVIKKLTGGVSVKISAAMVSFITDIVNIFLSGVVYYFTHSYALSLLVTFAIPTIAVLPWFAEKTIKNEKLKHQNN
jgi:ABC-type multidrug transport system fused ATPase/permease subunit